MTIDSGTPYRPHATGAQILAVTAGGEEPDWRRELHEAWLEFGRHSWPWQMFHKKPRDPRRMRH